MEYIILFIVLCLCGFFLWKANKKRNVNHSLETKTNLPSLSGTNKLNLQVEEFSLQALNNQSQLVEIKDKQALATVATLVPDLFKTGTSVLNTIASKEKVYRAIIPYGATLDKSTSLKGGLRATYRTLSGKIRGQANLQEVNGNPQAAANAVASAMGVASMIVGQYYMHKINMELDKINSAISQVADFQNNEYRGKISTLITQIKKVTSFKDEILNHSPSRNLYLTNLDQWEHQCMELLDQALNSITSLINKTPKDYAQYEKTIEDIHLWISYKETLLEILNSISELKYTLNLGELSKEHCSFNLNVYSTKAKESFAKLNYWHHLCTNSFKINIDEHRRKRMKFNAILYAPLGWFDKNKNFCPIPENISLKLMNQSAEYVLPYKQDTVELFKEDVQLIAQGDKLYYLPQNS